MSISVVTLGTSTWPLVDRLERLHGGVTVVRRCLDLAELLACAHTRMAHVALVAEGAEELTASLLDQLETDDLRVLVVEGHDESRVQRLGVGSVPPDATGEELARIITRAMLGPARSPSSVRDDGAAATGERPAPERGAASRGTSSKGMASKAAVSDGAAATDAPSDGPTSRQGAAGGAAGGAVANSASSPDSTHGEGHIGPDTAGLGSGGAVPGGLSGDPATAHDLDDSDALDHAEACRVFAVWGPVGAPGRTVTSLNLAAELALLGRRVLLVDADTYAASVAASLGMLDEAAGLAQACRLADQARLDREGLRRCASTVSVAGASLDVLTGITRYDRWPEIRGSALELVLDRAREDYDAVVVDTASGLESDEEISSDFMAPRRNAGTLTAVAAADVVIALGAADTLGVPRLVKALPDLLDAAPDARIVVVMNKLRAAATGRSAAESVREAWERFSPGHPVAHTLSWDAKACDDALLAGAVLAETAPRSTLRHEMSALAELVRRMREPDAHEGAAEPVGAGAGPAGTRLGRRMGAWLRHG
ncbi:AAA family ATPase [Kocuria marina]|uniref:AAA family ATPase n=1 Tax=Kocuria marina TaxID=223184 RepID=UPI0011A26966|nr:AAA family ATPase [Kocuria indica]